MSSVFSCSSVRMLVIVLSNTIAFRRYGVTAPVTCCMVHYNHKFKSIDMRAVQDDDNVRRGQKKQEI